MRREDVRRRRDVCEETKEACDACASGVRGRVVSSDEGNRRGVHVGRSGPVDRLIRISATAWSRSARSEATTMTWWAFLLRVALPRARAHVSRHGNALDARLARRPPRAVAAQSSRQRTRRPRAPRTRRSATLKERGRKEKGASRA
eukprot:31034-Pelagococcus_subviridis.AAC.4